MVIFFPVCWKRFGQTNISPIVTRARVMTHQSRARVAAADSKNFLRAPKIRISIKSRPKHDFEGVRARNPHPDKIISMR